MEKFYFSRFTFSVRCKTTILLPSYNGSTLRGGFGHAFRRIICAAAPHPLQCFDIGINHPSPSSAISTFFVTPTRIKYKNSLTKDLEFHVFFRNLLRRISLLSYFHCNHRIEDSGFKDFVQRAGDIKIVKRSLYWHDWERYSNRQKTRIKMGGFMGEITYEGELGPFWPYIKLCEYVHVGKGNGFGLGKYRIEG